MAWELVLVLVLVPVQAQVQVQAPILVLAVAGLAAEAVVTPVSPPPASAPQCH